MERLIKQMNRATESTELIHEMLAEYERLLFEYRKLKGQDKDEDFAERKERLLKELLRDHIEHHFDWNSYRYRVEIDKDGNPDMTKEEWLTKVKEVDPTLNLKIDYMTVSEITELAKEALEDEYNKFVKRAKEEKAESQDDSNA